MFGADLELSPLSIFFLRSQLLTLSGKDVVGERCYLSLIIILEETPCSMGNATIPGFMLR